MIIAVLAATGLLACTQPSSHSAAPGQSGLGPPSASGGPVSSSVPPTPGVSGDGSVYSPALPQAGAFVPSRLPPGGRPPQFVIVGFDGSGDVDQLRAWADLTRELDSHVTYFLSGVFMLTPGHRMDYRPPRLPRGTSAIGFAKPQDPIGDVTSLLSQAWLDGNDIGTHFNGHFCGAKGINSWTTADWTSEITQFNNFVDHWRSDNHLGGDPTAYDHTVVVGGRTPCLEGRPAAYLAAMAAAGYRYDTSGTGRLSWPRKTLHGLWEFPLQRIAWKGTGGGAQLAMDYNLWYRFNHAQPITTQAQRVLASNAVYASYLAAFHATYSGNRAPLFLGNHMNYWGCDQAYTECNHRGHLQNPSQLDHYGPFVDGLQRAYRYMCVQPDAECISYKDMAAWLDVQDPATVAALPALPAANG